MSVKPLISPEDFENLRKESQRNLIDFIEADIQIGLTFAESAAYERDLGKAEHSRHLKKEAAKAMETIRHFLKRVANLEIRNAIARRAAELDRAMAAI